MTARRLRIAIAAVVVALVIAGAGFLAGRLASPSTPTTSSAAAGFLRDMQVHHAQAVELALIVRDRTDDPEVRLLAYDIATAQGQQGGQMYGLLEGWDLPQASTAPRMTWMSLPAIDGGDGDAHGHRPGAPETMPGMASADDIAALGALDGVDAERRFLELMIAHHLGGVEMAEAVLARSDVPQVVSMAGTIVTSQRAEVSLMDSMLAVRG